MGAMTKKSDVSIVLPIENSCLCAAKQLYNNPAPIQALSLPDNWCWMILLAGIYYPERYKKYFFRTYIDTLLYSNKIMLFRSFLK